MELPKKQSKCCREIKCLQREGVLRRDGGLARREEERELEERALRLEVAHNLDLKRRVAPMWFLSVLVGGRCELFSAERWA